MIHFDPLVLILRLTFLTLMASGFTFLALTWVALDYVGMDQVWGLWGIGCALVLFVFAAMVGDALKVCETRKEHV